MRSDWLFKKTCETLSWVTLTTESLLIPVSLALKRAEPLQHIEIWRHNQWATVSLFYFCVLFTITDLTQEGSTWRALCTSLPSPNESELQLLSFLFFFFFIPVLPGLLARAGRGSNSNAKPVSGFRVLSNWLLIYFLFLHAIFSRTSWRKKVALLGFSDLWSHNVLCPLYLCSSEPLGFFVNNLLLL